MTPSNLILFILNIIICPTSGQCGSCWAFAIAAVVEAQNKIFNNVTWPLAEQELMDCDYRDKGCQGGFRGWGFE